MWECDRLNRPIVICCWKYLISSTRYSLCCANERDRYPSCMCIIMWPFYSARGLQCHGLQVRMRHTPSMRHLIEITPIDCIRIPYSGGHPWLFGLLNCFVHFVMYGYYFGSVYRPSLKQNVFLKKSITQMQIVCNRCTSRLPIETATLNDLFPFFRFNSFW